MFGLLLLALQAAPAGVEHASLHPKQAFFYADVPDVSAMLGAYEHAPLVAMLRDEKVHAAVYGVCESFDIDLDEKFALFGKQMGLPPDKAAKPVSAIIDYMRTARSASFSMSFMPSEKGVSMNATNNAIAELAKIAEAIKAYRDDHDDKLPASLDELELGATLKQDAWGHPYSYKRAADGDSFDLRSLGADGKEGGDGANADIVSGHEDEAAKRMARGLASELGFLAVCRFDGKASEQTARDALLLGATKLTLEKKETTSAKYRGASAELIHFAPNADFELPMWMLSTDDTLVIGAGITTPEVAIALADGKGESLAQTPRYRTLPAKLGEPKGVSIVRFFVDTEGLTQFAYQGGAKTEQLRELLARSGGEMCGRMQLVGDRFTTEFVSTPSTKDYFGKSMGCTPFPAEMWKCVPDDAIAFLGTSVDGPALYKELLIALHAEQDVTDIDARIKDLDEKHGINLERDLFRNLGGGVVGYLLPIKGPIPSIALIVDLKDAKAFAKGVGALLDLLGEQSDGKFDLKYRPYTFKNVECPMWTFTFDSSGGGSLFNGMMAPSPTIAIIENRALVTLYSTRATKEIKRLLGDEKSEHPLLKDPARPPAEATMVGYVDQSQLIGGIYKTAMSFMSLAGGFSQNSKFDASKLPDASLFTHFFKPSIFYTKQIEGGIYSRLDSSFGPETVAAVSIGIAGTVLAASEATGVPAHLKVTTNAGQATPPKPPSPPQPASPEVERTRDALSRIATAIAVFKVDHGKLPATLDELSHATKNFPKGFLNGENVPNDAWNRPFVYWPSADGKSYALRSLGADGIDQNGGGDDVSSK